MIEDREEVSPRAGQLIDGATGESYRQTDYNARDDEGGFQSCRA
jgi:hypothetical protein